MLKPLLLAGFGVKFVLAASNGIPVIDAEKNCRTTIAHVGTLSNGRGVADCVRDENDARATLEKDWSTYVPADRSSCIATVTYGMPSYTELLTCLEMARDVRKLPPDKDELAVGLKPKR